MIIYSVLEKRNKLRKVSISIVCFTLESGWDLIREYAKCKSNHKTRRQNLKLIQEKNVKKILRGRRGIE